MYNQTMKDEQYKSTEKPEIYEFTTLFLKRII